MPIYAILQLGNGRAVTRYISEINFVSPAVQGDLIEMGLTGTPRSPMTGTGSRRTT